MKGKHYYNARAAYMRELAGKALTEKLRESCLKSAAAYDELARQAGRPEPDNEEKE